MQKNKRILSVVFFFLSFRCLAEDAMDFVKKGISDFEKNDYVSADENFLKAEKIDSDFSYSALIGLYRAQMNKSDPLSVLAEYEKKCKIGFDNEFYADYQCAYAEIFAEMELWEKCLGAAENAVKKAETQDVESGLKNHAAYLVSLAFFQLGEFEKSQKCLHDSGQTENSLYGKCLFQNGETEKSLALFEKLRKNNLLTEDELVDYSIILFCAGKTSESTKTASLSKSEGGLYMTALNYFNQKEWKSAADAFSKYIKTFPHAEKISYAEFYLGYSEYRLGDYESSIRTLQGFTLRHPSHSRVWDACMTCADAMLHEKKLEDAAMQAERAISVSKNEKEKEESILLCVSVYSDMKRYQKAIDILSLSRNEKNEFSVRCRYQIADIYARLGKISESDAVFAEIQNRFRSSALADESSYRRGELYYSAGRYDEAVKRFSEYQKMFPAGQFLDSAVYYIADCHVKSGSDAKAIVQYDFLLSSYPESVFVTEALKALAGIYRRQKRYSEAANCMKLLFEKSESFVEKTQIKKEISFLNNLADGDDEDIALLDLAYGQKGGASTQEGRVSGTELAEKLLVSGGDDEKILLITGEILSALHDLEISPSDIMCKARVLFVEAKIFRKRNDGRNAAEKFLESASHAEKCHDGVIAEKSLYGAVEAYDVAGMKDDAKAVFRKFMEMYPESIYLKNAERIVTELR